MPLYDYHCKICQLTQEIYHAMSDSPLVRCPRRHLMRRLLSSFNTPTDKRYEFTTTHVKPGTVIRSKGQWERFLRTNNLTDDISPKEHLERVRSGLFEKKCRERRKTLMEGIKQDLRKAAYDKSMPRSSRPLTRVRSFSEVSHEREGVIHDAK